MDADLLIHVVDASNPEFALQIEQVQKVLLEIGADAIPQLLVFNKMDAMEPSHLPILLQDTFEIDSVQIPRIFVSAKESVGLDRVRQFLTVQAALNVAEGGSTANAPENSVAAP